MITPVGNRSVLVLALMAFALLVPLQSLLHAQGTAQKVKSIQIRGNKRIEDVAIRGRLTLKIGDPYNSETIRQQIRLIYEMGYFEDVQIETEPDAGGVGVVFVVREKPFITEIVFDGNQNLSEDKLKEKVTIRGQSFLDLQQAKESAEKIRLAYQEDGYYNAQVIPIILSVEEDRKRLTFYVKEGEKAKVKRVNFDGAKSVTKKQLFKIMATREWVYLLSTFTDAGVLKREELTNDVERIREVYLNHGFLNVQISQPAVELTDDKQWFIVTFTIVEGEQYTVAEVGFRGNTVFEEAELRSGTKIKPGEVFQRAKIRDEITRLTELYGAKGYAFTDVDPSVKPDFQTKTAAIIFNFKEGELIRVREIHIAGNDKTRDNVIRRELRLAEQEVIDTTAIKRSFQRLNNLNFFETVEILPKQVGPDTVDLDVKVKEKSTGAFSIGGGFSTLDQLVAIADITEGNLGGKGQTVRVRGQLGQRRSLGLLSFREPYFQDTLTSLQADAYRTQTNYITYYEDKLGASLTFGRWFSEFNSGNFALVAERLIYADPSTASCTFFSFAATCNTTTVGANPNTPQFILNQFGTQVTTGFRSAFVRDTRDYYLNPRSGWRNALNFDFGTPYLGGTNNFYKILIDTQKYTPLPFGDVRYAIRLRAGITQGLEGKPIPLTERFFVGGINTMRGFVFGRAGPVVPGTGSLLGAAEEIIINNDFVFTISSEAKLNASLFFDYGKGFDTGEGVDLFNLRKAAGIEGRWISPFGPLRAAYGINLVPQTGERRGVFEFTVGSIF